MLLTQGLKEKRNDCKYNYFSLRAIPDSWNVINGLELREVTINKFPRNLTINGNFTVSKCNLNINNLPNNLTVDGNVYIDFEYKDIFREKYPNLKIR